MRARVLILCEHSGIVRNAFADAGCDAWSCDLLPSITPGQHYTCDAIDLLRTGQHWDLIISHPPCTYLSYAGNALWSDDHRALSRCLAATFFMQCWHAPARYVCVENPRGIMYKIFRQPDQEIHPYYFGDSFLKRTGLWLRNLPLLKYQLQPTLFDSSISGVKPKPYLITKDGKALHWLDSIRTKDAGLLRSRTSPHIARAMVEQWLPVISNKF